MPEKDGALAQEGPPQRPSNALPPLRPCRGAPHLQGARGRPRPQAQTLSDAALVQAMPLEGIYAPPRPPRAPTNRQAAYKRYMSGKRK